MKTIQESLEKLEIQLGETLEKLENNPISPEEEKRVNSVLDLDIEISSLEDILSLKKEYRDKKYLELHGDETSHLILLEIKSNVTKWIAEAKIELA